MTKKCSECVYSVILEEGWVSAPSWGHRAYCGKFFHPNPGFDPWDDKNNNDLFAESCKTFLTGKGVIIDMEAEDWSEEDQYEYYSNGYVTNEDIMEIM